MKLCVAHGRISYSQSGRGTAEPAARRDGERHGHQAVGEGMEPAAVDQPANEARLGYSQPALLQE
jgi:hypothetical protein